MAALTIGLLLLSGFLAACSARVVPPAPLPVPLPAPQPHPGVPGPAANQPFLLSGEIKDIGSPGILVEGSAPGAACWVKLPHGMPLVIERPDGTTHDLDPADVTTGLQVSIWHDGPVLESYPCQATGAYVKVHADPGDRLVPPLDDVLSAEHSRGPGMEPAVLQASIPADKAELARLLTWLLLAEPGPDLPPPPPIRGGGSAAWTLRLHDDGWVVLDFAYECEEIDGGAVSCDRVPGYVAYTDPDGELHVLRSVELFNWLEAITPEG